MWDLPLRLFHWLLAAAVAVAFLSSEESSPLAEWHMASGWAAAMLVIFRLAWGFVGGEHARFASFVRPSAVAGHLRGLLRGRAEAELGHNPLGGISVLLLLAMVALVVASGASLTEATEDLHETLAWGLLALVGVHVFAVLLMSFLTRENLVAAMIGGNKASRRHPGARDARSAGAASVLLAAATVLAAAYLLLRYEPLAFQPRVPETSEHQGDLGASPARAEREEDEFD